MLTRTDLGAARNEWLPSFGLPAAPRLRALRDHRGVGTVRCSGWTTQDRPVDHGAAIGSPLPGARLPAHRGNFARRASREDWRALACWGLRPTDWFFVFSSFRPGPRGTPVGPSNQNDRVHPVQIESKSIPFAWMLYYC